MRHILVERRRGLALGHQRRCARPQSGHVLATAERTTVFVALTLFGSAFADTEVPPTGTRVLIEAMPSYHLMSLTREAVSGHARYTAHIAALAATSSLLALLVALT